MYKIAIIYAGATYESALNHIRLQELLGKIKVIGIGTQDIYAEYVDGYPVTTIENILQQEWDYLLIAGQEQNFAQMKALLVSIGICLLYTSDAADEEDSGDLGGRSRIKKKKRREKESEWAMNGERRK